MQFFGTEILKEITKTSSTTVQLESGSDLRIGGQSYRITSDLILDINADIDIGVPSPNKIYYVYAVAVFGSVSLKYSLSSVAPSGYQAFKKIGALYLSGSTITVDWVSRDASEANTWQSITYGNNLFVAVSSDGTNRVMTSSNGTTWTARAAAQANNWQSITYGNNLFVAVAASGTNRVMTSLDGITWTARNAAQANGWSSVAFGNNLFVAVSSDGTNRVMTSSDGITWTARNAAQANTWSSVTYGDGLFVAVTNSGTNRVMTSPDGITWTARNAAEANQWRSVTYGGGLFVAVAVDGTNRVMTSSDGITWTARSATEANLWRSVAYGDGVFVAVSTSGTNRVMTSVDGITWTARTAAQANSWSSIIYGNESFVAVAESGTNRVMTSADILFLNGGSSRDSGKVGDVMHSTLTEEQFIVENGSGWILADGRSVVGTRYASLIGTSVPDMRGQFLRGKNNNRTDENKNPDGEIALGVQTGDTMQGHWHAAIYSSNRNVNETRDTRLSNTAEDFIDLDSTRQPISDGVNGVPRISSETRPKNVTVNIFIKIEDIGL
jgi:hypothetical protein